MPSQTVFWTATLTTNEVSSFDLLSDSPSPRALTEHEVAAVNAVPGYVFIAYLSDGGAPSTMLQSTTIWIAWESRTAFERHKHELYHALGVSEHDFFDRSIGLIGSIWEIGNVELKLHTSHGQRQLNGVMPFQLGIASFDLQEACTPQPSELFERAVCSKVREIVRGHDGDSTSHAGPGSDPMIVGYVHREDSGWLGDESKLDDEGLLFAYDYLNCRWKEGSSAPLAAGSRSIKEWRRNFGHGPFIIVLLPSSPVTHNGAGPIADVQMILDREFTTYSLGLPARSMRMRCQVDPDQPRNYRPVDSRRGCYPVKLSHRLMSQNDAQITMNPGSSQSHVEAPTMGPDAPAVSKDKAMSCHPKCVVS